MLLSQLLLLQLLALCFVHQLGNLLILLVYLLCLLRQLEFELTFLFLQSFELVLVPLRVQFQLAFHSFCRRLSYLKMPVILMFLLFESHRLLVLFLISLSIKVNIVLLANLPQLILLLFELTFLVFHLSEQSFNSFQLILLSSQLVFGDGHLGLQFIYLVHGLRRTCLEEFLHLDFSFLLLDVQHPVFFLYLFHLCFQFVKLLVQGCEEGWIFDVVHSSLNPLILNHHVV